MFPDKSCLQLINVAGSDEEAIVNAFNEDYASIYDEPRAAAAFKRAMLFETSDAGEIDFYYFYL